MKNITKEEALAVYTESNYPTCDFKSIEKEWLDPFDQDKFYIANNAVAYSHHTLHRFSDEEIEKVKASSKDVPCLATHSAGVQLLFETDARTIDVKVKNSDFEKLRNMPFIGQFGFDSYYFDEEANIFKFYRGTNFPVYDDKGSWTCDAAYFGIKKKRKIILNFPLYSGVEELSIGVEKGCYLKPWKYENPKKILCYGTSILQGAASCRPGLATTNVVSRHFKQEVLNYGFSGACLLEKEVAEVIASRNDLEMMIIDPEANAGLDMTLYNNIEPFLDIVFEKHPNLPVVLMSRIPSQYDGWWPNTIEGHEFCVRVLKEVTKEYKEKGRNIRFYDNYTLFDKNDTEFTIECLHPNDIGMRTITNRYIEVIETLKKEGK